MKKICFGGMIGAWLLGALGAGASEPPRGCFRSVAEAVAQTRAVDPETVRPATLGFRLEERRHDALLNKSWARVSSCDHPERPAITVESAGEVEEARLVRPAAMAPAKAWVAAPQVMFAGTMVRLVRTESNLRFDTVAIAQASGAVGERIRVRVLRSAENAGEAALFLMGTIRSADVLEMEP